jgi:hypothetical protein
MQPLFIIHNDNQNTNICLQTNLVEKNMGQLINLCCEARPCIHDKGPQVCTRSHTAYIQAIFITLLNMLGKPRISYIIVVSAQNVSISISPSSQGATKRQTSP